VHIFRRGGEIGVIPVLDNIPVSILSARRMIDFLLTVEVHLLSGGSVTLESSAGRSTPSTMPL